MELELLLLIDTRDEAKLRPTNAMQQEVRTESGQRLQRAREFVGSFRAGMGSRAHHMATIVGRGDAARDSTPQREQCASDLVVLGSSRLSAWRDFFSSSVPHQVLRWTVRDILIVPRSRVSRSNSAANRRLFDGRASKRGILTEVHLLTPQEVTTVAQSTRSSRLREVEFNPAEQGATLLAGATVRCNACRRHRSSPAEATCQDPIVHTSRPRVGVAVSRAVCDIRSKRTGGERQVDAQAPRPRIRPECLRTPADPSARRHRGPFRAHPTAGHPSRALSRGRYQRRSVLSWECSSCEYSTAAPPGRPLFRTIHQRTVPAGHQAARRTRGHHLRGRAV
jgi:hypothetical protein